jgi:hypothetical protein
MAESEFLPPPWRRVLAGSLLLTPVFRPIATQAPISSVEWLCQSSKLSLSLSLQELVVEVAKRERVEG